MVECLGLAGKPTGLSEVSHRYLTWAPRTKDFPGETFRVLKQKEIAKYGEYRTRRLVLAAWDRMFS